MPVPPSSLSVICDHIRSEISTGISAAASGIEMTLGAPAAVEIDTSHQLNLFFYRFEPSGFEADQRPDLPWNIRMFCMVTPFGIDEADGGGSTISAGENDMRMLGDVMRHLHENPILPIVSASGIDVRPRVVFMSSSDEQINQIWSTQGDTHYRPSAVFEMSLTPIVPDELMPEPAIVGAIGSDIRANGDRHAPFAGNVNGPPVPAQSVDISDPGWIPLTALVHEGGLHRSLSFDVTSAEFAGFTPQVWIAGDTADPVDLIWQAWRATGWETVGGPQVAAAATEDLDPLNIPTALPGFPVASPLPEALGATADSLQMMLFAERSFTRISGGPVETVRSAPILITLWRSGP